MTLALLKPLGVLLLVTACAGRSTESPRTSRSSEAVPATELANRRGDGPDPEASLFARDINVPTITVGRPLPESALPLVIGPDAVRIGVADPSVVPLPSREVQAREGFGLGSRRHGLHGYVVLPLASALSEATCAPPPPLAVYADATTPYKVLLETLMTARRVGFKQILLVGRDSYGRHLGVDLHGPANGPEFAVGLLPGRAELLVGGHRIDHHCTPGIPGLILPLQDGTYEYAAARRCLDSYAGTSDIVIRATTTPSTTLQVLLEAAEALMKDAPGPRHFALLVPGESNAASPVLPPPQSGQDTAQTAAAVVERLREIFRACYQRSLTEDPEGAGEIRLTLHVAEDGQVRNVKTAPSGNLKASVVECVRSAASTALFQPPANGKAVIVVPVRFVRSDVEKTLPKLPRCGTPRSSER